jgi:hypothetical protein
MPDVPDSPASPAMPAQNEQVAPQAPPSTDAISSAPIKAPLTNGQRWRNYQIGDPINTDTGWCYQSVNAGTLEDVWIRVLPSKGPGDVRAQTWSELQSLNRRDIVRPIDVKEEGD